MRIDRALCCLRLVKTRSRAAALVEAGHIRRNGERVTRASQPVAAGDVLTVPLGKAVKIIELLSLPERRGPPAEALGCYRVLDPSPLDSGTQSAIAAATTPTGDPDT